MAQFDVYVNPSARQREVVPYIVDVQSGLLDQLPTRWIMPLVTDRYNTGGLPRRLCPSVLIGGVVLFAWPHQTAPMLAKSLGRAVASLRTEAATLLDALDAVTSGI